MNRAILPVFHHDGPLEAGDLRGYVASALPRFLPGQRWFGDKSRIVDAADVQDVSRIDDSDDRWLVVVRARYATGEPSRYLLPLAVSVHPSDSPLCALESPERLVFLIDGLEDPEWRAWLLETILTGRAVGTDAGGVLRGDPAATWISSDLPRAFSRVLRADQSNSSLVFGDTVLMKLFRRLQAGPNPDAELVRFLSGKAGFANVPKFAGTLDYVDPQGERTVLAIAQEFVGGAVDGWSHAIGTLAARLEDGEEALLLEEGAALGRTLGEVTARMHLALASDPWTPDLAPEPVSAADIERWSVDYTRMLDTMLEGLRAYTPPADDDRIANLVDACLRVAPGLHRRTDGFRALTGRVKTRVHGDYHLGQTLRRDDGQFIVLDFEGEPARPVAERRLKTSPLKDVAGMLRSFGYARGTIAARLMPDSPLSPSALVAWERTARSEFVARYTSVSREGGAAFLPESNAEVEAAIAAWELDKATYEVVYELNNRPDWLWIPLSAMIKHGEPARPHDR